MDTELEEARNNPPNISTLTIEEPPQELSISNSEIAPQVSPHISPKPTEKKLNTRILPAKNVPERIVVCLDTCADPDLTEFKLGDGSKYSPLYMLKRVVEIFVQNKHFIDSRHEFSLLTLDKKNVKWVQDFTNSPREIINALHEIKQDEPGDEFHLDPLLDAVWQMVTIPKPEKDLKVLPPFIVRLILLYSRSYCTAVMGKSFKELLNNPYFTIDVVITHEETLEENKLQEIFDSLLIDPKGFSYHFSVGRNPTLLHDSMAKLLGHPLQRPLQSQACYKAPVPEKEDE